MYTVAPDTVSDPTCIRSCFTSINIRCSPHWWKFGSHMHLTVGF